MVPLVGALVGCGPPEGGASLPDCGAPDPAAGEVRVCRLGASDVPEGSGAKAGDWRMQNAVLDVVVRDVYAPLTRLEGAGGTVVAAMPAGHDDPVLELVPELSGGWFDEVDIDPVLAGDEAILELHGALADGAPATMRYRLPADSATLQLDGATGFTLVPWWGDERVGSTIEHGEVVLVAEGDVEDAGGTLRWLEASAVTVAPRAEAYRARWPDGQEVEGTAPGAEWVEARAGGAPLARLPVDEAGRFAGTLPPEADALVARATGFADGPPGEPSAHPTLQLGGEGRLRVRVADERGVDIWATVERDGVPWAVPPGGRALPVGAGTADTRVWAGPGYEQARFDDLEVGADTELSLQLQRVDGRDDHVLARIGVPGWPDRTTRAPGNDVLAAAAAQGVQYTVIVAEDEVAWDFAAEPDTAAAVRYRTGSRAGTADMGTPLAWPWTPDSDQPGHGAVPWQGLDPWQLFDAMERAGTREIVVDPAWMEAAGPSADGRVDALGLWLGDITRLEDWLSWVDRGETMAVIGPWTWVEGVDPEAFSEVDVERAIWEGRTVASTGPRIRLRVQGEGPGSLVTAPAVLGSVPPGAGTPGAGFGPLSADGGTIPCGSCGGVMVELVVNTPSWAPVEVAVLYGPGGRELARFEARAGGRPAVDQTLVLHDVDWIVAAAWGSTEAEPTGWIPWAVTTPVWVRRDTGRAD